MPLPRLRFGFGAIAAVLLIVPAALGACSSDDPSPAAGGDAAVAETGNADTSTVDGGGGTDTSTPTDSGACTSAVNGGTVIPETAGSGTFPTPAGGTILDGTYYLTKHEVYPPGAPDANMRKRTWVFSSGTFQAVNDDIGKPATKLSGTMAVSGTKVTLTVTCPMSVVATINFTATATTFTEHASSGEDLFIFTKQ